MCHLIADTPEELLAMTQKIGVQLKWFQSNGSTPHFDISKSKRELAIEAGAQILDRNAFVAKIREIRKTWPTTANGFWTFPHFEFKE